MIKEYVKSIEPVCGDEKEFIVILNYEKQKEAVKKIIGKGKILSTIAGILTKLQYENKELKITGNKILIKNVQSVDEVKELLNKLFT